MEFLDKHLRAVFSYTSVEGWLVFRVEMLGVVLVTGIAILAVVENYVHEIDPGTHICTANVLGITIYLSHP